MIVTFWLKVVRAIPPSNNYRKWALTWLKSSQAVKILVKLSIILASCFASSYLLVLASGLFIIHDMTIVYTLPGGLFTHASYLPTLTTSTSYVDQSGGIQ